MSDTVKRIISFVVIVSALTVIFLVKSTVSFYVFAALALFMSFMAAREFSLMLRNIGRQTHVFITSVFCVFATACALHGKASLNLWPVFIILAFFVVRMWFSILFARNKAEELDKALNSMAVLALISIPFYSFCAVYSSLDDSKGVVFALFLLAVTKAGDTGGYIFGVLSGKFLPGGNHKVVPSISPKKSWEGLFGGLIFSVAVSFALWMLMSFAAPLWLAAVLGVIFYFGGFAGDLAESSLKRICGVKDSGNLIPGMGGVMDVTDSLLINAPLFYFILFFSV
jgi:phosphatidate cytidylyltransferase